MNTGKMIYVPNEFLGEVNSFMKETGIKKRSLAINEVTKSSKNWNDLQKFLFGNIKINNNYNKIERRKNEFR
jgi:metal-responsive CopG/Arc/MetJ family transcriptional regulator